MKAHINGWFKPAQSATRISIRSEAYELDTHFVAGVGSARCQVGGCELCGVYGEPKRTNVHIIERSGSLFLLELNPEMIDRELVVGDELIIQRRQLGDMTETFVRRDGFEPAPRVWPDGYLAALGQKAYDRALAKLGLASSNDD